MSDHPYLEAIALTHTTPCLAEPGKFIVTGKPNRSLDAVLPYLAALPNVIGFNPETLNLTFRRPHGFMTLSPNRISITQVKDSEEGVELFAALTEAINATWENQELIIPVTTRKKKPSPIDIYNLLPKTNCKLCGESTCWAFASKLTTLQTCLEKCHPIFKHSHSSKLATLREIIS